jgi:hypothetical protein
LIHPTLHPFNHLEDIMTYASSFARAIRNAKTDEKLTEIEKNLRHNIWAGFISKNEGKILLREIEQRIEQIFSVGGTRLTCRISKDRSGKKWILGWYVGKHFCSHDFSSKSEAIAIAWEVGFTHVYVGGVNAKARPIADLIVSK